MSYVTEVLADSPSLYWRLDEASGTTATDSTANARNGTLSASGITYSQTGAISDGNKAMLFDGSAGSLRTAAAFPMSTLSAITVEFWLKIAAFNNTDDMAMEVTATGGNATGGWSIDPCAAAGNFAVWGHTPGGTNEKRWTRPSTGGFHHYAFVLKKSTLNGAITGYLDGSLWTPLSTTETDTTDNWALNQTLYFMARGAASLFLAGTMDEVAVYPSDIGAARIAAHFSAASGAAASGTTRSLLGVGT